MALLLLLAVLPIDKRVIVIVPCAQFLNSCAMELAKRKRMSFTVEQNVEIIKQVDSGGSQVNVANLHGISANTVGTICKNGEKFWKNGIVVVLQESISSQRAAKI